MEVRRYQETTRLRMVLVCQLSDAFATQKLRCSKAVYPLEVLS